MLILRTQQKSLPLQLFILEMNNFRCPLWNLQEVIKTFNHLTLSSTAAFSRGATLLAACVSSQVAWAQAIAYMCIHSCLSICSHTLSHSACPVEMVPCWSDNWWTFLPAAPSCSLVLKSLAGHLGFPSPALTRSVIYKHQGEWERLAHVRSVITVDEVSCLSAQRASASCAVQRLTTLSIKATLPYLERPGPWRSWQPQQWACSSFELPARTPGTVPLCHGHPPPKCSTCQQKRHPG